MGGRPSRRNQLDPQQDVIYQDLNHRVLISSASQKPLPTSTISAAPQISTDVYVHRNSIALEPDSSKTSLLWLEFVFDAKVACEVTIHSFVTEVLDAAYITREYTPHSYAGESQYTLPKQNFTFGPGLAQKFPPSTFSLDVSLVPEAMLICKDRRTYPLVLDIVRTTQHPTEAGKRHSFSSLVALQKEGEGWKVKVINQKFNCDTDSFYVEEIFGLQNTEENECVVCMTDKKDTSVLPCRHLCLCSKCAHTMRSQKQPKCPICRSSKRHSDVQKLLQVKD